MAACVQEDVRQRPTHLARRSEKAMVVTPVQHRAAPSTHAIDRARETRRDALHAVREGLLAVRLDDQVGVIALQRVVGDAEVAPLARLRERTPELVDEPGPA